MSSGYGASGTGAASPNSNVNTEAVFLSRADIESMKHDPMRILQHATGTVVMLEQQDKELEEENERLREQLKQEKERQSFTPEAHAALLETSTELEVDHRELSQKFTDLDFINKMLQGLVDALRNDKEQLARELSGMKSDLEQLVSRYSELMKHMTDVEEKREGKDAQLKVQQEEIDVKIKALDDLAKECIEATTRTVELQETAEKIGSTRLSLESETTALEQTTQQQERTLAYLQNEVAQCDKAIHDKAAEMVQLKKTMAASILELQQQITKYEGDMARVRTSTQNENDLTGRQNLWIAKDLKNKLQELLLTRQEMTKENAELKSDLTAAREKASRLRSNVLVYEKRHQAFSDTVARLEQEDTYAKEAYAARKDGCYHELNSQASRIQEITHQLQSAREDLYMIKSRLCKHCRMSLLHGAEDNK
jgi:chromosome segregation ATPase